MQAIVRGQFGGPEQLMVTDLPTPVPGDGEVLVRVRAFGINRAEIYMREGLFGEVAEISGIECVGQVEADPGGRLPRGQKVIALMGGMGRTRNGSYAEYACVRADSVYCIETDLSWDRLAAIPESYATAWSCLVDKLGIEAGQVVLIRGGTSALGQAAIDIAKHAGTTVLASTRSEGKRGLLERLGASQVLIEDGELGEAVRERYPDGLDGVLDLIGNSTLYDSIFLARKGGRVCMAGFLGGMEPVSFDAGSLIGGVQLSAFASYLLGTKEFPLSDIPMQEIVDRVAGGSYQARPVRVFPFEQIAEAHRLMESNSANGKIVIVR
jgi:NADPH:quinone reductase-like Zn-dependent oxidoreductase